MQTLRRKNALGIHSLNRFVFSVPDLDPAEQFYDAFGLDVRRDGDRLDLHTHGHAHCWGSVHGDGAAEEAAVPELRRLRRRFRRAVAAHRCARRRASRIRCPTGEGIWIARSRRHAGPARRRAEGVAVGKRRRPRRRRRSRPARARRRAARRPQPVRPRRLVARAAVHAGRRAPDRVLRATCSGLRLSDRSGDIIAFMHGPHASDHHLLAFAKSNAPGLPSFELGRRQHRRRRPRRRADEATRATRKAGASGATCSARTISTTCRIRGGAGPSIRTTSTSSPADVDWPAADHPPEDSFYVWGPTVPDDFVINHEQPRARVRRATRRWQRAIIRPPRRSIR